VDLKAPTKEKKVKPDICDVMTYENMTSVMPSGWDRSTLFYRHLAHTDHNITLQKYSANNCSD